MRKLISLVAATLLIAGCQQTAIPQAEMVEVLRVPAKTLTAQNWLSTTSMPRMVDQPLSADEVAYILRKTGFEPPPDEVEPWIGKPRSELVRYLLRTLSSDAVVPAPEWTGESVRYWGHGDWPEAQRAAFRSARQQEVGDLRLWWISQMLATPSPMGERMVMFWENTFVAGFSGLNEKSHAQWYHHESLREHAIGSYAELLTSMLRDPAVLIYLDNNNNREDAPNENLARELLELFTLGESNYTERDIKEAARALAGWHVSEFGDLSFQVSPWAQDRSRKTIFGQQGNFNGDDLADLILAHPEASKHVSRRLWQEFISSEAAPEQAINQFASAFVASGYRIDALLEVMLNSAYFWDPNYRATSVKSPVELVIGAIRASKQPSMTLQQIDSTLGAMGQTLFDPPDVSGWGYGEYWLDPAFLIERDVAMSNLAEGEMQMRQQPMMLSTPKANVIKVKVAGEAYNGPPQYRVQVEYADGKFWYSDNQVMTAARDTERLGRYKDESEWVWETQTIELPAEIETIRKVGVRFLYDAAGNGGDRNLFVGAVEWRGQSFPGAAGTQFPGCSSDKEGAKRHPDRLYCAGTTTLDWEELTRLVNQQSQPPANPQPGDLLTRELAVLWFKRPSEGGWQGIDLMFDGLSFEGREWDYFGFKFVRNDRGRYEIAVDEDRCKPSCFTKWPRDAWRDKAGLRHVSIGAHNYDEWSRKQYRQLSAEDKRLVKALFATAPRVLDKIKASPRHNEPGSLETWRERLEVFVDASDSGTWRPETAVQLIELNSGQQGGAMAMAMMGGMSMSDGSGTYPLAGGKLESQSQWQQLVQSQPKLSQMPLEQWMVSIDDGERFASLSDWLRSPLINLK
ncbi:MAG TPA: DUF1800 family protein [Marinobacterium sp.]|nr:DUF1800 family protein [Marinobacterium sp.]